MNTSKKVATEAEVADLSTPDADLAAALNAEERDGYRLAFKGRLFALLTIAVLLAFVTPYPEVLYFHLLLAVFAITGLVANGCQNQTWFKPWHNYPFVLVDFALLSFTLLYPNPLIQIEYAPQSIYHFNTSVYLYVLLAGLAFTYRPKLVLFGGIAGAVCWGLGLMWMLSLPETLSQMNVSPEKIADDPIGHILTPGFIDLGLRLQEAVVFLVSASLIAAIVMRSRRLVTRQVKAERERHFVSESLGKYVPVSVASAIIADRGFLKPQRHTATMLYADIEDFTGLVERTDPADVFAILNDYFSSIGAAIVTEGGVINQFQGDAVLATFNLPVQAPDHADAAIRAARSIREACENRTFAGHHIRTRIGIATGEVISGSVGSGTQLAYTVHGDAVNLAARLEQMNKETGTTILVAEETITCALEPLNKEHMGDIPIRGHAAISVYSV